MPTVKNKPLRATKKTSAKKASSKKSAKKSGAGAKKLTASKRTHAVDGQSRLSIVFTKLGIAGTVAASLTVFVVVGVLWASGVFGRMVEDTQRAGTQATSSLMVKLGFQIDRVIVRGRTKTDEAAIANALGPVQGASLMHFNIDHARARIEQLGWVRSAAVSRLWPDQVVVSIRERKPAAIWQVSGQFRLVDREGAIIREAGQREFSGLPWIVGAGAPEAAADILAYVDQEDVFDHRLTALVRISGRRWNLRIGDKMDIKLPETGYIKATQDLVSLHEAVGVLDRNFEYIDLRDPERVYVRCHASDVQGTQSTAQKPEQVDLTAVLGKGLACS